jgi:hypothetical protein
MCLHPKELDPKEPRQAKTERGDAQTPSANLITPSPLYSSAETHASRRSSAFRDTPENSGGKARGKEPRDTAAEDALL